MILLVHHKALGSGVAVRLMFSEWCGGWTLWSGGPFFLHYSVFDSIDIEVYKMTCLLKAVWSG